MILYHTSDREIRFPDIRHGRKNADCGQGFYLTPDRGFTYRWAGENAVVNIYEFDETGLDILRFARGVDWFDYIFHNRRLRDDLSADAVIGPISNDTIFDTLGLLSSGFLKPEEALRLLSVGPEYTQAALKTEKAVSHLKFIRSERIERTDAETLKAERKAYGEKLEEELKKMAEEEAAKDAADG